MPPLYKTSGKRKKDEGNNGDSDDASSSKTSKPKTQKLPPPTPEQKQEMLAFMAKHPNYANGRIKGKNGHQKMLLMHDRLAAALNSKKGTPREGAKWWKSWVSIRLSNKAYATANYKVRDNRTGGGGPNPDVSIASDASLAGEDGSNNDNKYYTDNETANIVMSIIGWHNAVGLKGVADDLDDTQQRQDEERKEKEVLDKSSDDEKDVNEDGIFENVITSTPSSKQKPETENYDMGWTGDMRLTVSSPEKSVELSDKSETSTQKSLNCDSNNMVAELSSLSSNKSVSVGEKLDNILSELKRNTSMLQKFLEHIRDNSIMVLTPASAEIGQIVSQIVDKQVSLQETTAFHEGPLSHHQEGTAVHEVPISQQEEAPAVCEVPVNADAVVEEDPPVIALSDEEQEKINEELDELLAHLTKEGTDKSMPDLL